MQHNWFPCTGQIKTIRITVWCRGPTGWWWHNSVNGTSRAVVPTSPSHWYDAILPLCHRNMLQNIPSLSAGILHPTQLVEAVAEGRWRRFCWCCKHQLWLIVEQIMKSSFVCTVGDNVIVVLIVCLFKAGPCQREIEPWYWVAQSVKKQLSYISFGSVFPFFAALTSSNC